MKQPSFRLAVVIPTRNRPRELASLLASLACQVRQPDIVVVVDGSDNDLRAENTKELYAIWPLARYLEHWPPSAAAQRNRGLDLVLSDCDFVALLDDDITLSADALEAAIDEIVHSDDKFIGFGLNPSDADARQGYGLLRCSRIVKWLGLYSDRIAAVTLSGWHTRQVRVETSTEVEWLTTCAVIWRGSAVRRIRFDEFFEQYSYLEDLEFSLQARKCGRFLALASASVLHKPAAGGRKSAFWFGCIEIRNRLYIVRKHGLSQPRFWLGVGLRAALTLGEALSGKRAAWQRLGGNMVEVGQTMRRHALGGAIH